jgi:hypothetical protein
MKHFTIITLLIIVSLDIYSQATKTLIIRNKDTLEVNSKIPIDFSVEDKLKYYNENGEKIILRYSEVDEIQIINAEGRITRMIRHINPFQVPCDWCEPQYFFLRLLIDGEMKLLQQNVSSSAVGSGINGTSNLGNYNKSYLYYQKGEEEIFIPNDILFKREMIEYLSECEELVNKIKTKEYKKRDAFKIVEFYNSYCGK